MMIFFFIYDDDDDENEMIMIMLMIRLNEPICIYLMPRLFILNATFCTTNDATAAFHHP
jgi:hypothetical protein